jgi:hypothetical protein
MKNKLRSFIAIAALAAVAVVISTGCADVQKKSSNARKFDFSAMVSPQGAFTPKVKIHPSTNGVAGTDYDISYEYQANPGTNGPGTLDDLLKFRDVPVFELSWLDSTKGGAFTVLADPKASQITSTVNNQTDLGGNHTFNVGDVSWQTSSNAAQVITAGGSAVGSVVGQIINKGATGGAAP